jgi:fido (protein-threonine AMPylation protein)
VSYIRNVIKTYVTYTFIKQFKTIPTSEEIDIIISNLHHSNVFKESDFSSSFTSILKELKKFNITLKPVYLFSEAGIKALHKSMAHGLIDKSAGVAAGEYRIDNRIVGDLEVIFPAPELIPKCMEQFVSRANSLVDPLWLNSENLFEVAAMVSHEFVRIHPFPDFNGRLSRLILTIILNTFGVPFPVTLRGDKKGRHRYLNSLRKANKGHLKPYITLIAMRVSQSFMEIDENLRLEGLPSILTFLPGAETNA